MSILDQLNQIEQELHNLANESSLDCASEIKDTFFGKTGKINQVMKQMRHASPEEKPRIGQKINTLKDSYLTRLDEKICQYKQEKEQAQLLLEAIDITCPSNRPPIGVAHPIKRTESDLVHICSSMGFSVVTGPIIEDMFHNFEALNIPETHPARDMHDTFYLTNKRLLRTHTSSVQIRTMKASHPPIKIISPGQVFRSDADRTHSPMFHQLEGLYVNKNVGLPDLKHALQLLLSRFFSNEFQIRFRSSYFPFTEPSFEVDVAFNQSGDPEWMEVLGAGMVHPNVLTSVGIDPMTHSGFAFGLGIDRLAMLKYSIRDIRSFYENDTRFLRQEH